MEIFEAIKTRRSVRRFRDQDVEEEKLAALLEAVRQAPSWANMQCWRLVVVRRKELREQISELSFVEAFFAPTGFKVNPSKKGIAEAPVVILLCAEPEQSGELWGQHYYMTDIGIAAQNLMLAAHSQGLGTVFVGVFEEHRLKELLKIPEPVRIVGVFPLGYPRDEWKEGPPRKPLSEIVHYDGWS